MTSLAKSILTTLAFFDAQDMPLTVLELRNYLVRQGAVRPSEVCTVLENELANQVGYSGGFYFLSGRASIVESRRERYRISLTRFRKCKKYLSALRHFPYLRAVAISGSLALLNSRHDSDIDLFMITKKNRIWLTRLLVSLYFQVLGVRRHGRQIRSRFCLNHYLSEGQEVTEDRNLYTAVEYSSLIPVLGVEELGFFSERNSWISAYLPSPNSRTKDVFFGLRFSGWQKISEMVLDVSVGPFLNWISGLYQKRRIQTQEHILVSDTELSFHPGSRGQRVLRRFQETLEQIDKRVKSAII